MKETFFRGVLEEIEQSADRAELIKRANYTCEGKIKHGLREVPCKFIAWSTKLYAQLSIRSKRTFPEGEVAEGFKVMCPSCTARYDKKYPPDQRRAS